VYARVCVYVCARVRKHVYYMYVCVVGFCVSAWQFIFKIIPATL